MVEELCDRFLPRVEPQVGEIRDNRGTALAREGGELAQRIVVVGENRRVEDDRPDDRRQLFKTSVGRNAGCDPDQDARRFGQGECRNGRWKQIGIDPMHAELDPVAGAHAQVVLRTGRSDHLLVVVFRSVQDDHARRMLHCEHVNPVAHPPAHDLFIEERDHGHGRDLHIWAIPAALP